MEERAVKQVIVMRKDLNMRKGKMIAQGAHASVDALLSLFSCTEADGNSGFDDSRCRAYGVSRTGNQDLHRYWSVVG